MDPLKAAGLMAELSKLRDRHLFDWPTEGGDFVGAVGRIKVRLRKHIDPTPYWTWTVVHTTRGEIGSGRSDGMSDAKADALAAAMLLVQHDHTNGIPA